MLNNPNALDTAPDANPVFNRKMVLLWALVCLLLQYLVWGLFMMGVMAGKHPASPLAQFFFGEPWRGWVFLCVNAAGAFVLPSLVWQRLRVTPDLPGWAAYIVGLAAAMLLLVVSGMLFLAIAWALPG
jgi:hypothetical protein